MRYINWLLGHNCHSCPRSSECSEQQKGECPGPALSPLPPAVPARSRLNLETLELREVFSVNPIIAENLLPGNPQAEWDVAGAGDSTIQGFATDMSVDQGQTISFKVNDTALAPYHIDIYRLGYYSGLGARKVATIDSTQTTRTVQPNPLTDAATKLVDAGNWSVSASWSVPSTAVSGLYIGKLVREDTGGSSHMLFVVRDDDGGSDLLFQTSDTTWQAYNNWGGNSTYDPTSTNNMRAYAVSYNRPLTIRGIPGGMGAANSPFWAEVPMIRWLESNGYNVSYFSGVDTDRYGAELLEHKAFLSVGHDEYWSGPQRANVEAALAAGVNLSFFSGNEMYWKIRWENSIDGSGTAHRTMVTYKESTVQPSGSSQVASAYKSGVEDPSSIWTGLWRDLRFANDAKVEQLLTGQIFSVNRGPGGLTGTAIQVPAEYAQMRLWRNTSVASLQAGQVATLANGTLGYEWDEDVDSGFRPAGAFNLSSTTENVPEKLVDPISWPTCGGALMALCSTCRGCAVAAGTATHNLTEYRAPSGALVFGAGTIQWSWGLDGVHDGGASTPDVRMQQATVNLFADMGVQAGALRAGLVQTTASLDITRPTSTIITPTSGGTATLGTPTTITGTASDSGGGVVAGIEVSTDGGLTWRKATGRNNWSYTWTPTTSGPVTVRSRAVDDNGNLELPGAGVTVTVNVTATSTAGLVAAYNFNAGSGTTVTDNATGNNNGTITNATWSANGVFGTGALSFNGTDAYVTIPDADSLDLTSAMTLEAWVNPSSVGTWETVLLKERGSNSLSYALYGSTSSGRASAYIGSTSVGNTANTQAGIWTHLAATYDGSSLRMYVNGNLVDTLGSGSITTSTGALRIGGNAVWGEYFDGLIDEVRVYNRALSESEIRSDMSTPIGGALDAVAPTVSMQTPSTSGSIVTLSATASDNIAISGVQFLVNGQPVGAEVLAAPYSIQWNTLGVPNGTYSVSARARDFAGNVTTSSAVSVTVSSAAETTPPTVALTGLPAGTAVTGTVILSAVAADNIGVVGVQFKVNGANVGSEVTSAPYQVAWNTAGLTGGNYTITAVARDAAGNTTTSASVTLVIDATAPTVTAQTPANGTTSVPTNTNPTVTFSEAIQPATLSFVLKDAGGNPLAATVAYNAGTKTATLLPTAALTPSATYSLTVSGVTDLVGNVIAAPVTWSFTTANTVTAASIWGGLAAPTTPAANDSAAIEVGVKFRSAVAGTITGLMFYKGVGNTGTHVGHLWSGTGTLLATATFANETGSGWQTVTFANPVAISANTTYVASYYAPVGRYAVNSGFFATAGVNSYPLRALASGEDGGNGVYKYGSGGGFPTSSYNSSNYWIDVIFSSSTADTTGPAVASKTPAAGSTDIPVASTVTVAFGEPIQANTLSFVLKDAAGATVASIVAYNDTTWTATLTPTTPLANSSTYTATVSGAKDAAGNAMTSAVSWSFTTIATAVPPPSPPTSPPPAGAAVSLWGGTATPATTSANDSAAVEVGVKFRTDTAGYVTSLMFYKGSGNTGTHVGHLWSGTGTLLATATFANETASGWQMVNFATPVAISANTTYVASYYAPVGHYAANSGFFATGVTHGSLTALATGIDGGNGVYKYGSGGGFPTSSYNSTNYWVDVIFSANASDTTAPTVIARTPAPGDTGVPVTSVITATFNEAVNSATVTTGTFVLTDAAGTAVAATVSYDSATRTATLTPTASLATHTTYTVTVNGVKDTSGNQMTTAASWSFTTPTPVTGVSLWSDAAVPATAAYNDSGAIEVGMKFLSDVGGTVTGLRFYKGAGNTGTHVGHLWAADGTLLASATFTNESATGWQTVTFAEPVTITNNTLYVVSYYAPNGHYAVNAAYFAGAGVDNGPLHAPADGANGGNGLYRYGSGGGFPGNSYNSNNYWVDVVFTQSASDTTTPTVTDATPAAGAKGVLPSATISVTFSEDVQPNTVSLVVTDPYGNQVTGNLSYDPLTHTATFIPSQSLLSFVTYTVTVSGAKDIVGNSMSATETWSFTTRGIWTQTSAADFSTGTNSGTTITNTAGGELRLSDGLNDDFAGTGLNTAEWTTTSWTASGGGATTVAVADGAVSIKGAALYSVRTYTNSGIEGRVSFGGSTAQHFGMATSLFAVSGQYWAIFSTKSTTNTLYARVNANGTTTDVSLGALPTGYHTYKILPTSGGFQFYVDGVLKTTITASFQTTIALKAALSNFSATTAVLADSIKFLNVGARSGTFTSMVFDAGKSVTWDQVNFTANVPTGTTLTVSVRVGTKQADGSILWRTWRVVQNGDKLVDENGDAIQGQYLQYSVSMTSNDASSPEFDDITFTWQ